MSSLNRPNSYGLRPVSTATSIDSASDFYEETQRRRAPNGWTKRATRTMESTIVEDELDVSDAESIESLSSRAKMMNEMLSDSDSMISIDGRRSTDEARTNTSISSFEENSLPSSPAPEYSAMNFPMSETSDRKDPSLFRTMSLQLPPMSYENRPTLGPKGPHLFRSFSTSHATNIPHIRIPSQDFDMPSTPSESLSPASPMSPITPPSKAVEVFEPQILPEQHDEHYQESRYESEIYAKDELSASFHFEDVRSWSPRQVCAWMTERGFEQELVEKFRRNDISGSILSDLKWEDLKELDIQSFGKRYELWTATQILCGRTASFPPSESPPRSYSTASRVSSARSNGSPTLNQSQMSRVPSLLPRSERSQKQELISEEIESSADEAPRQVRPQVRKRSKRTQARMPRRQFSVESIATDIEFETEGDSINYINHLRYVPSVENVQEVRRRKGSDTEGALPYDSISVRSGRRRCRRHAEHSSEPRKPHRCSKGDRCRKHGKMSGSHKRSRSPEHGMIVIATTPSIADISALPSFQSSAEDRVTRPGSMAAASVLASSDVLGPIQGRDIKLKETTLREIGRMDPLENVKQFLTMQHLQHLEEHRESPPPVPTKSAEDLARAQRSTVMPPTPAATPIPTLFPRHDSGMPASRPIPIPLPTPAPTCSPSPSPPMRSMTPSLGLRTQGMERAAPPNLNSQSPISRTKTPHNMWIRTTTPFSEADVPVPTATPVNVRSQSQSVPPDMRFRQSHTASVQFLQSIPSRRGTQSTVAGTRPTPLYMTSVDENAEWEAIEEEEVKMAPSPHTRTHSGWMKKRRTNWFRHEWPDYHFVLKGTRLGYAKNIAAGEEAGFIEMDDYSVACSANASTKLAAAFKSSLFGKKKGDLASNAYFFQLVPASERKGKSLGGKVHYFAVGSREERIDWMRELMLAKAIKQKKAGFEVEVNGQRI
ncbi:hypothetical protein RUND412_002213 [Rhizina undulata]